MPDRTIKCVDCGQDFIFTEREQEWYREKGLSHDPRRCRNCRAAKKSGGGGGGGGGHHDSGPSHHDGGSSSWSDDRPRRGSREREMHKVACATCGKETEVPFKPDPSRPVYCRDCFQARGKKR